MSSDENKKWMKCDRKSGEYIQVVRSFIQFSKNNGGGRVLFSCPCRNCMNGKGSVSLSEISFHLLKYGICLTYTTWRHHGESSVEARSRYMDNTTAGMDVKVTVGLDVDGNVTSAMDMDVNVTTGVDVDDNVTAGVDVDENVTTNVDVDENVGTKGCCKKKLSAAERARVPLYPSCPKGKSALYVAIMVNNIKTQYAISDNGMTAMLELMKELLPEENTLPNKFPDVKKIIQELRMDYVTYDACVNDCILYWKDKSSLLKCLVCQEPRYVRVFNAARKLTQVAQKTLRHFPIIARMKIFYSIPWIAEAMLWNFRAQKDINVMRHPVDSSSWHCADSFYSEFSKEARNVTLGIATDGFNPNGCFGLNFSCWPVILCPYNLPPSMCMKREFSMLCFLISGPRAPGKDIDVYLQPLIEELKELWNDGVMTFDNFTGSEFLMRSRLLWAIHDFPALGTLSGCLTHGYFACPSCGEETDAEWLPYSKKLCYMGHRRCLPTKHKFRDDKTNFSGGVEHGKAPWPLTGLQVQEMVANLKRKQVRHCTDVMHTEKNITEHIVNTILGNNKSKDGLNARKYMEAMGIKKRLWLKEDDNTGKTTMEDASFALTKDEKVALCTVLKNLRVPSNLCSNLRNNVGINPPELKNLKSHDYHVMMQSLFPLLVHTATSFPKDLRVALLCISLFFNILCAKVINREHLLQDKASSVEAMCVLEKYFPPSFFVISIHLMIHLADEALICGPIRFRWMYPFERLMKGFKGLVRNKRYIEGCIARGYSLREASLFFMDGMSDDGDGTHKHTRRAFLDDDYEFADEMPLSTGKSMTLTQVQFEQCRNWILSKYFEIDDWQRKYDSYVSGDTSNGQHTSKSFHLIEAKDTDSTLWRLVQGPLFKARSYRKYQVNGFTFNTLGCEAKNISQNSGVSMKAFTILKAKSAEEAEITYYGVIKEIIVLNYMEFEETGFCCDWVSAGDKNACKVDAVSKVIKVNLSKMKNKVKVSDETFILASEATQVFYSKDLTNEGWSVVLHSHQGLTFSVDKFEVPTAYQSILTNNENFKKLFSIGSI
ncbi:uncharacterized protein LOC113360250 [Papaver somniferum]|uniref:uncharacterized protein LOC113360250 n=1 Tax=Papaver somniferum TaxID=3469 RepID=UPI000E7011A1|nr:uncharacterized protein LOC113360250 [Papaver somniferum]